MTAAVVASAPPVARAADVPFIVHREATWPVTAAWHETNTRPFPFLAALSRQSLYDLQMRLLAKSNQSVSEQLGDLTAEEIEALSEESRQKVLQSSLAPHEHALLQAANAHFNVRTCIDLLVGRPISDFGFEGVDQVHHNRQVYACGCQLNIVFDHHRRFEDWSQTNERQHHPHYPTAVCDFHSQHFHSLDELHLAVQSIPPPKPVELA